MPEHLKAFLVITVLMTLAYFISKRFFSQVVEHGFVGRLYGTGFIATAIMFLSHNIWIFLGGLALVSIISAKKLRFQLALYIFLLLLIPGYSVRVPGFGLINYLIDLSTWRVLSLTLLVPATFHLMKHPDLPPLSKLLADKLVIFYAVYTTLLVYLHYETFTGGMRYLLTIMLDMVLIYFVASRGLMIKGAVRHVMVALIMAAIFLALVGAFEFFKHWLLYSSVQKSISASPGLFGYLGRGDVIRASATTGQPIVLGFVMMVALLATFYVQRLVIRREARILLWLIMVIGLIAAMSRGPWVATAIGVFVIALASTKPVVNVFKLLMALLGSAFILVMIPGGEKIIDYLPWVGSIDAGGITFREVLWKQSLLVMNQNLWIGEIGYTNAPEYDVIRLGGGFVDIVNTYLVVILQYGLISLILFCMLLLNGVTNVIRAPFIADKINPEISLIGIALLATIIAIIFAIWMVSSISHISLITIFIVGASTAYSYLAKSSGR